MMPGLYVFAAVGIVAGALGFAGGWNVQGWRLGEHITKMQKEQSEAINTAIREARAQESGRFTNVQEAKNAATKRAQIARADADRARSELDRLRGTIEDARGGVPGESAAACTQRADTAGELLATCAGAYLDLARHADYHANDARTLIEAWPK